MLKPSFVSFLVRDTVGLVMLGIIALAHAAFLYGLYTQEVGVAAYGTCLVWFYIRAFGVYHGNWHRREQRGSLPNYRAGAYLVSFVLMAVFAAVWMFRTFHDR